MPAVLVVDDEAVVRRTLVRALTRGGFTAECAASGEEALERIAEHEPDILVADVYLNGMNGLELIEVVRDRYPQVHPQVITGRPSQQISERAHELGAGLVLEKPITPEEFRAAVTCLLEAQAEVEAAGHAPARCLEDYDGYLHPEIERVLERMLPEYLALVPTLAARYPGLGQDRAHDCIVDVVLGWYRSLVDTASLPYPSAVLNMARKKASTVLQSQERRTAREERWWDMPTSVSDAADDLGRRQFREVYEEIQPLLPDEECRTIHWHFLECERDTALYAAALGISHLPLDEQRADVQRVKGRLRKVLSRNHHIRTLAEGLREC
ncbi:MAG: response regulator [Gemmatimonadota bacterium]